MFKDRLFKFFEKHQWKIICSFIGFVIAVVILIIGFFKTLFITLFIAGGYYLGKKIDNKEDIAEILDKILPPGKIK